MRRVRCSVKIAATVAMMFAMGCADDSDSWECGPPPLSFADWPTFDAETAMMSGTGEYAVMYDVAGRDAIPTNERFSLIIYPFRRSGNEYMPFTSGRVRVDAAMPQHGHGMNVVPTVTQQDNGSSRVEGMLFHMPGRWEIYFDITRNGVTERAQTEVLLE